MTAPPDPKLKIAGAVSAVAPSDGTVKSKETATPAMDPETTKRNDPTAPPAPKGTPSIRSEKYKKMARPPTMDEILDDLYTRQYHHGDSYSEDSGDSAMSGRIGRNGQQRQSSTFVPFAARDSMKRTWFYGACLSAAFLLTVFVLAVAIGLSLIHQKLNSLEEDMRKLSKLYGMD